jgi:hypothetical protein
MNQSASPGYPNLKIISDQKIKSKIALSSTQTKKNRFFFTSKNFFKPSVPGFSISVKGFFLLPLF